MNLIAVIEIAIICVYFVLPFVPAGNPFSDAAFSWESVNYAPILTGGTLLILTAWWFLSARKWFTGPKITLSEEELTEEQHEVLKAEGLDVQVTSQAQSNGGSERALFEGA